MGSAAHELDGLRAATDVAVSRALSDLVTVSAGSPSPAYPPVQLVVVGPGCPGEFNAAGPVSFASFGRDVVVPALVQGQPPGSWLPTPIMVARYLGSRDIATYPEHAELWASARWITTGGDEGEVRDPSGGVLNTQIVVPPQQANGDIVGAAAWSKAWEQFKLS